MNILIADDEILTREGIINGIAWSSLGFDQIRQADDGIHALEICQNFHPDVLLTDVRMPRCDGIQLALRLQSLYPELSIVFMSGYSDKEYLKAAIRLKAISYVEKPINLNELSQALVDAASSVRERQNTKQFHSLSSRQQRSLFAIRLTQAGKYDRFRNPSDDFGIPLSDIHTCFTALIQCYPSGRLSETDITEPIFSQISLFADNMHMGCLFAEKSPFLFLIHFFARHTLSDAQLQYIGTSISQLLTQCDLRFHVVFGKQVLSPERLYASYHSAVINLQKVFFERENTCILHRSDHDQNVFSDLSERHLEDIFSDLLLQKKETEAMEFTDHLLNTLLTDSHLLPNQVRDLYYRLLSSLNSTAASLHIRYETADQTDSLWALVSSSVSIYSLHEIFKSRTEAFFQAALEKSPDSSYIYMIQNYISTHLADADLSIQAISNHMHLSSSYVCTLFKAETGDTLNHYITAYRMKRARDLLMDPRNRIAEISAMVGFSDRNYFSKAFKKNYGLSPSEFRDSLTNQGESV